MTFRNPGRTVAAVVVLIAQTLIMTACSSNTIDFLYVATSSQSPGQISAYEVDHLSGALRPLSGSPFTVGNNPIALVASPDGSSLYVVNQKDNTVQQLTVGSDGKLASKSTIQTPGTLPISIAIDPQLRYLYVLDTYAPGKTYGAVAVISLNADGSFGSLLNDVVGSCTLNYFPVGTLQSNCTVVNPGISPTAIAVMEASTYPTTIGSATNYQTNVYVTGINQNTISSPAFIPAGGALYSFLMTGSVASGASTPTVSFALTGTVAAGTLPVAVTAEPRGRFVYVADQTENQMYGYSVFGSNLLQRLNDSPFKTGIRPTSMTVDPRGLYLLVSCSTDETVSNYTIDPTTGDPSATMSATGATGPGPVSVAIEPALGRYVYSANHVDNSVSGFKMDPSTGALSLTQNSPYPTGGGPTAIAIIAHGDHPTVSLAP
jgi:6-phosphogluconolactonase (cycloisomerase 2 family)